MNARYLNYASDLRRIAEWTAKGQIEMYPLASRLLRDIQRDPKVKSVLKKYRVGTNLFVVVNNTQKRLFFAEQALLASIILT